MSNEDVPANSSFYFSSNQVNPVNTWLN